mmetsp:Transcript_3615/g.8284  ORF Transcript_3615/g.8284 Transcript_3615/m.8284 type:complete len:216 (+) Transcript_3615:207-854(+)
MCRYLPKHATKPSSIAAGSQRIDDSFTEKQTPNDAAVRTTENQIARGQRFFITEHNVFGKNMCSWHWDKFHPKVAAIRFPKSQHEKRKTRLPSKARSSNRLSTKKTVCVCVCVCILPTIHSLGRFVMHYRSCPESAITTLTRVAPESLPTCSIAERTLWPEITLPKTTCFPSNHGVSAVHKKNCDPFVLGPALAIDKVPDPECLSLKFSSANFSP